MEAHTTAVRLAVIAAIVMTVGLVTRSWWHGGNPYNPEVSVHVGLVTAKACHADNCESVSLDQLLGSGSGAFRVTGKLSVGTGLAAVIALLVAAWYGRAGRWPDWIVTPASAALILCTLTLGCCLVALLLKPAPLQYAGLSTGPGFLVAACGATMGIVGAILLARARPTFVEDW